MDGFSQLKDLLPKAISKYGVQRELRAALIRDRARHAVHHIWGENATEVRPLYFKDGILTVEVENSAWGQEVFMKKSEFLGLIGLEHKIKDVKTKVVG